MTDADQTALAALAARVTILEAEVAAERYTRATADAAISASVSMLSAMMAARAAEAAAE